MKIELNDNKKSTTFEELKPGDTFRRPSTQGGDRDSVFIVVTDSWSNKAVDLENGEEITIEEDEVVIPVKVKVILDK